MAGGSREFRFVQRHTEVVALQPHTQPFRYIPASHVVGIGGEDSRHAAERQPEQHREGDSCARVRRSHRQRGPRAAGEHSEARDTTGYLSRESIHPGSVQCTHLVSERADTGNQDVASTRTAVATPA